MAAKTVLQYVQAALNVMDSDKVDSITDTEESQQLANLLSDVYLELCDRQEWPWLNNPIQPTSLANAAQPTVYNITANNKTIDLLQYDIDETGTRPNLRELTYLAPVEWLRRYATGNPSSQQAITNYSNNGTFWVYTDRHPQHWTSLDDFQVILDGWKSSVHGGFSPTSVLHGYGSVVPSFTVSDGFTPRLPEYLVPLLQSEFNAAAFNHFKQTDSKPDERRSFRQTAQARRRPGTTQGAKSYYANAFGRLGPGSGNRRWWNGNGR